MPIYDIQSLWHIVIDAYGHSMIGCHKTNHIILHQNEEFLIPSLPTAVGRFSFKTYSILLSAKYLNIVCSL